MIQHRSPGWPNTLVQLNGDLKVQACHLLSRTIDGHSILTHEGRVLLLSTGTNELIQVIADHSECTESVFWRLGDEARDCEHINSAAAWNGRLYVSMLGKEENGGGRFWQQNGCIMDVASSSVVWNGLFHPHSLMEHTGDLYCLESRRGNLWRFKMTDGHWQGEIVTQLVGYLRGLAAEGQYLYVGSSALRRKSKSRGDLMAHPHQTLESMQCWLYRVDLDTREVERQDMTPFGREIYDVRILQGDCTKPPTGGRDRAIVERQLAYDAEHLQVLDDLAKLLRQYEDLVRQTTAMRGTQE